MKLLFRLFMSLAVFVLVAGTAQLMAGEKLDEKDIVQLVCKNGAPQELLLHIVKKSDTISFDTNDEVQGRLRAQCASCEKARHRISDSEFDTLWNALVERKAQLSSVSPASAEEEKKPGRFGRFRKLADRAKAATSNVADRAVSTVRREEDK